MENCWFVSWFNTKYYHLLYKNRDDAEAHYFIDKVLAKIELPNNAKLLDVACGKGRHAKYFSTKGFEVTGIDLSQESIEYATQFENENLSFFEHDMRLPFRVNYFDTATNLFTSLGYFDNENDNYKAIKSIANSLKKNGLFIIDFFNAKHVAENLITNFETEIEGIKFFINKSIENNCVIKNIVVDDAGTIYKYQEKVQLLTLQHFKNYFNYAGLQLTWQAGDYSLNAFDENDSKRLILCCKKI